jgi:uncharacterized protein YbaP (TraB family)
MNTADKQKIMRYAELALKQDRQRKLEQDITPDELAELERIRAELGLSHEDILVRAVRRLIEEPE